jgi:hypothetical protein
MSAVSEIELLRSQRKILIKYHEKQEKYHETQKKYHETQIKQFDERLEYLELISRSATVQLPPQTITTTTTTSVVQPPSQTAATNSIQLSSQTTITTVVNVIQPLSQTATTVLTTSPLKKTYSSADELIKQITGSKIVNCEIKKGTETLSIATKYRRILINIWKTMPTQELLDTTTFRFDGAIGAKGYEWCTDINRTFQNKGAIGSFKEIINMANVNKLTIELSIKLKTGEIVYFKM